MTQINTLNVDGVSYELKDSGAVQAPDAAAVGQTVVVKAIDENGRPTAWEAADLPDLMVVNFVSDDELASLYCVDSTAAEIKAALNSNRVVLAIVRSFAGTEIFPVNWDDAGNGANVGKRDDYGWNHWLNMDCCFADGDTTNKTPGNELWLEF